jgi:hypothetical protein
MMLKRLFLGAILASLAGSAAIGIAIFVLGDFGDTQVKLLLTTSVIFGFSITALASAVALGSQQRWTLPLPHAGITASILAAALALAMIWEVGESFLWDDWGFRVLASLIVIAFGAGHLAMLSMARPRGRLAFLFRGSSILSASAVAILLIVGILAQPNVILTKEVFIRTLGVLLILDVLSNVALLLHSRLSSSR